MGAGQIGILLRQDIWHLTVTPPHLSAPSAACAGAGSNVDILCVCLLSVIWCQGFRRPPPLSQALSGAPGSDWQALEVERRCGPQRSVSLPVR
uniref:Uncharacterized protein n=1 Tax=Knipowitschia caucasica TaxID=637954 RepID=A0AAV2K8E4_KNICA